jgi:hypothetical protein
LTAQSVWRHVKRHAKHRRGIEAQYAVNWPAAVLALKTLVSFPVLLPQQPPPYTSDVRMYAIVEEQRPDYYSIDLAATPDCNGAHVCSFAHVIGSKKPLPLGYVPSICAAYCNDATLTWKQGSAYYEITLKAGALKELRGMQRSMRALEASPRHRGGNV